MVDYINKGKNLIKKSIHVDMKNEFIDCCDELLFGVLSYSSYIVFNTMEVISSIVEKNEYKTLGTKSA